MSIWNGIKTMLTNRQIKKIIRVRKDRLKAQTNLPWSRLEWIAREVAAIKAKEGALK